MAHVLLKPQATLVVRRAGQEKRRRGSSTVASGGVGTEKGAAGGCFSSAASGTFCVDRAKLYRLAGNVFSGRWRHFLVAIGCLAKYNRVWGVAKRGGFVALCTKSGGGRGTFRIGQIE
ncbi:MAG: hypothetical protein KatS3mg109_1853 [Pirellulaceae bacterium]|nr:MAG: hypothetical protein KatS3mg109_1853 [Pirellulaceae bacterium]